MGESLLGWIQILTALLTTLNVSTEHLKLDPGEYHGAATVVTEREVVVFQIAFRVAGRGQIEEMRVNSEHVIYSAVREEDHWKTEARVNVKANGVNVDVRPKGEVPRRQVAEEKISEAAGAFSYKAGGGVVRFGRNWLVVEGGVAGTKAMTAAYGLKPEKKDR